MTKRVPTACRRLRRRSFDLAIVATANVHGVPLLTLNDADLELIEDLVDVRRM
jgi:predicted nucleic acid-binding protein